MPSMNRFVRVFVSVALIASGRNTAWAATVEVRSRDELVRAAAAAEPGTRIAVAPGTYEGGITLPNLRGAEGRPIVIAAADPARPPVIEGGAFCLHLTDPAYVELCD